MEYQCNVCGARVGADMIVYLDHTEKHVIDLVKHDHPEWIEQNGICQKCLEYYQGELRGSIFKDAACVLRQRKVKSVLEKIGSFLKSGKA